MEFSFKRKNNINLVSLLVILLILISTGFLLALIVNFMHGKFSSRLIKISFINSFALAGGVMISLFITGNLVSRIKSRYIFLISFGMIVSVSFSGFLYILILEPFFFFYGSNLVQSYLMINFVFALSLTVISSGFLVYQQRLLEKEKIISQERLLRKDMEMKLYNAQIQPHFLFNSFNLMVSLLPEPEKAEEAIMMLSQIIRSELRKKYWGNHFWSRGYYVNTVVKNEEQIRQYIKDQDKLDRLHNQGKLF